LALAGWRGRMSRLKGLVLALLTVAILWLLLSRIEFAQVAAAFARIPPWAWLSAAAIALVLPLNLTTRWWFVLSQMGFSVPWSRCLVVLLGVHPLSMASPSRAADSLRAYAFRRQGIAMPVLGGILAERLLDILVLATIAALSALRLGRGNLALVAGIGALAVLLVLVLTPWLGRLRLRPAWRHNLIRFSSSAAIFQRRPRALAGALGLTLLHWGLSVLMVLLLLRGTGVEIGYFQVSAALPLAIFVGLVPITFGGIGTRDAALVALLASSVEAPDCLAVSLLYTVFSYLPSALVGLTLTRRALDV
jgi:glycosyltransferase 2 family protein